MANISGTTIGATGAAVQIVEIIAATGVTIGETRRISRSESFGIITGNEGIEQKATSRLENALSDPSGRTVTRNRKRTIALKTAAVTPDAPRPTRVEASSLKSSIKNYRTLSHWNQNSKNQLSRTAHNTKYPLLG